MIVTIYRKDREGWAFGKTECGDLFVGTVEGFGALADAEFAKDTPDNRERLERNWETFSFAREVKKFERTIRV